MRASARKRSVTSRLKKWSGRIGALVHAIEQSRRRPRSRRRSLRLSHSRRVFAPLVFAVSAFALLFDGLKLLVSNRRLLLVQIPPADLDLGGDGRPEGARAPRQLVHRAPRPRAHPGDRRHRRDHGRLLLPQRRVRLRDHAPGRPADPAGGHRGAASPQADRGLGRRRRSAAGGVDDRRDAMGPAVVHDRDGRRHRADDGLLRRGAVTADRRQADVLAAGEADDVGGQRCRWARPCRRLPMFSAGSVS